MTEAKVGGLSQIEQLKAENPDLFFSPTALEYLKKFLAGKTDGITCWREQSIQRKQGSSIQGVGLFAETDVETNHVIAIKPGRVVDESTVRENADVIKGTHQQIGLNSFLAGLTPEEVDKNLIGYNHSCNPNAKVIVVERLPLAFLITEKPLIKGGEMTTDYSVTFTSNTQEILDCKCQSQNCRHHVQPSEDWKNSQFQCEHYDDFPYYIKQMIKEKQLEN